MSDILICKHCGKEMNINQFGRHLWKIHQQKYENYVLENLEDFKHLNWKLCSRCGLLFRGLSQKCGKCFTENHNIKKDQYIQCHYCDQHIHSKVISIHLKSHHNIEFLDYVKNNLIDFGKMGWCKCVMCGNITKNKAYKTNEPTCSKECLSELRKTWVGEKSPRFGTILSDETKEKISKSNTGIIKPAIRGNLNPACRKEVRRKISKTRIEKGIARGQNNPMYGKTHTPETVQRIFSHRKMNKLEEVVANKLNEANIPYYFQYFITENGICKSYDFKLKDKPIILEVDGDFWHGNPEKKNHYIKANEIKENDKLKDEMANKKGIKVVHLWESEIRKDPSIVVRTISPYIY